MKGIRSMTSKDNAVEENCGIAKNIIGLKDVYSIIENPK